MYTVLLFQASAELVLMISGARAIGLLHDELPTDINEDKIGYDFWLVNMYWIYSSHKRIYEH